MARLIGQLIILRKGDRSYWQLSPRNNDRYYDGHAADANIKVDNLDSH